MAMNQRERNALDNYITGHYGEDQFRGQDVGSDIVPDDMCDACGQYVANRECAHGLLCNECDEQVHGTVGGPCTL